MNWGRLELFDALALLCALGGGWLAFQAWRAQRLAQRSLAQATLVAARVAGLEQHIERLVHQHADYSPRLDWLETRARTEELQRGKRRPEEEENPTDPARLSITERRHRVLTLAKRGLEAEQIAATLGVPHGEVELIISLNTAA
jgi:hypothetical protein